jgi:hypothetical protein
MKPVAVKGSNRIAGNVLGICQNGVAVPASKILPLKANLLGVVPSLVKFWLHFLCQDINDMIDPPITLAIKPIRFQDMVISNHNQSAFNEMTKNGHTLQGAC